MNIACFSVRPVLRSGIAIWAILAASMACAADGGGAAIEYPGTPPGEAKIEWRNDRVAMQNGVLSLSWTLDKRGIRLSSLADKQSGRDLAWRGELFQIVLADG